jgi:UDP-N-acetylmuramyl pentapeptide phosphotransferase/UDP-N-acetylglucosamine-1-phosphate transferase
MNATPGATDLVFPPLAAFALAWIAQRALLKTPLARRTLDFPNHRSLHEQPIPRTGGVAIALGIAAGWALLPLAPWVPALMAAALVLAVVSLIDDMRGLSAEVRLTAHFVICAGFLAATGLAWGWVLLLLLPLVWGVNLYNFMDGLDGLAGGMTVLGFGTYALLAALNGSVPVALFSLCVAAAALGFLPFNFAPARVFLGDTGSIPLGFLAGATGIIGWQQGLWPLWLPAMVFSPFIADATITLLRRMARGVRLAEAHREHYYQRLAQLGFGHRNTALLEYGLMLLAGAAAIIGATGDATTAIITAVVLAALEVACLVAVDRAWKRNRINNGQLQ